MNIAICGFRHEHIYMMIELCRKHPEAHIIGAWETDEKTRYTAKKRLPSMPFYNTYEELLSDPQVETVAIGDYYGIRGQRILQALEAGRHVISDKPICTRKEELSEIERLCRTNGLKLGCLLDLRYDPALRLAQHIITTGQLGMVHTISFTGQHPLAMGVRPQWYFESGKHGGTFNDIAIHGLDAVCWITGLKIEQVLCARKWNAFAIGAPDFFDCAQAMMVLEGGAGLMLDVSYAAPYPSGMGLPPYWRFTFWGENGFLEVRLNDNFITIARVGDAIASQIQAGPVFDDPLSDFIRDTNGEHISCNTESIFAASQAALRLQAAADEIGKEV